MAPKTKITKDGILQAAMNLLRESGEGAVNARNIASVLNCSTQPLFSNFSTMEELHLALKAAAYDIYLGYLKREAESGEYPEYKSSGMAYIKFAKEEKELFKYIFMCERDDDSQAAGSSDFDVSVEKVMRLNGVSRETAGLIHLEMWSAVHGIATMHATSFLALDWDLISMMLSDIYLGIKARHACNTENTGGN